MIHHEDEPFGVWPALAGPEGRALVEAAASMDDPAAPAALSRLRRMGSAERVRGAVDLVRARRKAAGKFEGHDRLIADPAGVEQASGYDVAAHKARRFAEAGLDNVADLCCGIGGDAIALAEVAGVMLLDASAERVWMARHNVRELGGRSCPAAVTDVTTLNLAGRPFHLDPDRRRGSRRLLRYEDYRPGPGFIERLIRTGGDGAVKLSPAVDLDALPDGEVEIINRGGALTQAVLWVGRLRGEKRRTATRLPEGESGGVSLSGEERAVPVTGAVAGAVAGGAAGLGRYLLAVDPAVERAGLLGVLCDRLNLAALHPQLGLLTADEPVASPWLTPFELIEPMPWRPKRVKQWLAAHDGGVVEVKTRGKAVDPDTAQKELRGPGSTPYTVFVLRFERKRVALIARRCGESR